MRCIAIDDENPALVLIEDYIARIPFLHYIKGCSNIYEAIEVLTNDQIDLIFLDIELPGISGLEFLNIMPYKPIVIFITAYKRYALKSFELDVLDYLLKPVSFDRFLKAANKAYDYYCLKEKERTTFEVKTREYFFVYSEYNLIRVDLKEILYIQSMEDYVKIFSQNLKKPLITKMTMKSLKVKLTSNFVRIHRSYIVNIHKIDSIKNNQVQISNVVLPVGKQYKTELFRILDVNNI